MQRGDTMKYLKMALPILLCVIAWSVWSMATAGNSYKIKTKKNQEQNVTPRFVITAEYPEVKGLADKDHEKMINMEITQWVLIRLTEFRKDVVTLAVDAATLDQPSSAFITYAVKTQTPRFLGLLWHAEIYTAGAAHPSHQQSTMTYDLATGNRLTLADVFAPRANYLKLLSDFSAAELKMELAKNGVELFPEGVRPVAENFRNFLLTPQGLLIIFAEYQVAPYVAGSQQVLIPTATLQSVLAANSPLLNLNK